MTDPQWVKFVQLFPMGIGLGWLFWRYGVESCMLAHLTLNVAMLPLAQYLFPS